MDGVEMNEFEKFTCSVTASDGAEIGSGIIVQIDLEELLSPPSSLKKKVHNKPSAQEKCYALITAHSNVYEDCVPETPELLVVKGLGDGRKVVLVNSDDPKTIDETHVSYRSVSCCGIDSMLRMPQPLRNDPSGTQGKQERLLQTTLLSHDRKHDRERRCNIGYDFVVVFLKAELVRRWFPSDNLISMPQLSLTGCSRLPKILQDNFEVHMCWRSGKGSVGWKMVRIDTGHLESQPQVHGLSSEISNFNKYQSLQYSKEWEGAPGNQGHIGAPIVLHNMRTGMSHLIGINTGKGVTTLYGIFQLMKGGVIPFLAAMEFKNTRKLKPSRWEDYLLPHVEPQMKALDAHSTALKGQFVVDLLHYLVVKKDEIAVVKIGLQDDIDDVVAGLNVLAELLRNLRNVQDILQCPEGINCKCFKEFCNRELKGWVQHCADDPRNYKDIVEAIFKCFEALLNYEGVAGEVLETNIQNLIKIATHYDSNGVINRCCKNILIKYLEKYGLYEPEQPRRPVPATTPHEKLP